MLRCLLPQCPALSDQFSIWSSVSGQQRGVSWRSHLVGQSIFSQHPPGGRHQAGVVVRVVLGHPGPRAQQRQAVPVAAGQEERRPALVLSLLQGVGEGLAFALREQHDAEHGEDGEGGEDDVVEEVSAVVLELHQRGGGHADAACCQHQTQTTSSDGREEREETEWLKEQEERKRREGRQNG